MRNFTVNDLNFLKVSEEKTLNLDTILFVEFSQLDHDLTARVAYPNREEHRLSGAEAETLHRYLESIAKTSVKK